MSGSRAATARVVAREAIMRLCAGDLPPFELFEQVARRVRGVVPYASAGWLSTDPATLLVTGAFAEDVPPEMHLRLIDNEIATPDFAKFAEVARLPRPALALSEATGGEPRLSARNRELYAPAGFGDELRAGFRTNGSCWGAACLTRAVGEPAFTADDVAFLAEMSEHIGHGLRTGLLLQAGIDATPAAEPPGMVVLDDRDEPAAVTGDAERWLDELPASDLELPMVVYEVARRARAQADRGESGAPARARVLGRSGRWLVAHGARLRTKPGGPGRTAVVLEPARGADLAPLIAELHGLTERESQVTRLLLRGSSTDEIARAMNISRHTLRDHVKSIFAKCRVRSRAELTAMIFYEHFAPRP